MVTYTLQSYDKGIMSAATQFGFNTDLGLTTVIGHEKNGTAITNNKKYSNASMIFYIGYLCGTYPMMYLSQRYSTSRVLSLATFFWGAVVSLNIPIVILISLLSWTFETYDYSRWMHKSSLLDEQLFLNCVEVLTDIGSMRNRYYPQLGVTTMPVSW